MTNMQSIFYYMVRCRKGTEGHQVARFNPSGNKNYYYAVTFLNIFLHFSAYNIHFLFK